MKFLFFLFLWILPCAQGVSLSLEEEALIRSFHKFGRDLRERSVPLSKKYSNGRYLVFDCYDRHYVCANIEGALSCIKKRQELLKINEPDLPCFYLKQFKTSGECQKEQLKQVELVKVHPYCFNDD